MKCRVNKCFVYELLVFMSLWLNIANLATFLDPKNIKKLYYNYPLKHLMKAIISVPHQLSPKPKEVSEKNNLNDLVRKVFLGKKNIKKKASKQNIVNWHFELISECVQIIIENGNSLHKLRDGSNTISFMITAYIYKKVKIKCYGIIRQADI